MQYKFDEQYLIYGRDFFIHKPENWKLYDHVIASIDLAKREEHLEKFQQAGGWDVVVFDEGHKLTRYADGERAQRYRLAEALRPISNGFLLLSGTPHQGYPDRFAALLELVRPDLRRQIRMLNFNPEVVAEMILRNRKSEVTDAEGNFIFKGHRVHRYPVEPSQETLTFQNLLRTYLQRGYSAGAEGGTEGRAVGFVMTTYRKLASSSIAAIARALLLRRERRAGLAAARAQSGDGSMVVETTEDLFEGGDEQDDLDSRVSTRVQEFFEFEAGLIEQLLESAATVRRNDEKLRMFIDEIVSPLMSENKKLLVFTEYRATQTYLQEALSERFGSSGEILLINGSMKLDEKLDVIRNFNDGPNRFLISTEAGGEGLNLHRQCHVMVNYDLPWNPARLVQRIGRLYRYGQEHVVVVFNLHARDTFDNAAISLMMDRVAEIARDMAPIGAEFNERLYADILGDVLDNLDFTSVLQSAQSMELSRTREEIDAAIERAKRAKEMQDDILAHASGFDPTALQGTIGFTMAHVGGFIRGMLPLIGATVEAEQYDGAVLEIRLPDEMRGTFADFGQRTVVRITTDRRLAERLKDVVLLDFETGFFEYLISLAQSLQFDGTYSCLHSDMGACGVLAGFKLRWQNDQGEPLVEEFLPVFLGAEQKIETNPSFLSNWLVSGTSDTGPLGNARDERRANFQRLQEYADARLAAESTRFKNPNGLVQLAAADFA